jgi:hypothetical protein
VSNGNKGDEKKNGLLSQIISAVGVAILVGGTSPWWYNEFFKRPTPTPIPSSSSTPTSPSSPSPTPLSSNPDISGRWLNPTLGHSSEIIQDGNRFRFTTWGTVLGDSFQSSGNGTITGRSVEFDYVAQYQSGRRSEGQCSGTISSNGMRMTSTCTDSASGTFVSSAMRQ